MAEQNERTEKNTKIAQWAFLPNTTLLVGIKHKVQRDLVNRGPCVIEKNFKFSHFPLSMQQTRSSAPCIQLVKLLQIQAAT